MLAGLIHLGASRATAALRTRASVNSLPDLRGHTIDRIGEAITTIILTLALWPLSLAVLLGQGVRAVHSLLQKARR